MVRIDTYMGPAEMIPIETLWPASDQEKMGRYVPVLDRKSSISVTIEWPYPEPTAIGAAWIDMRPEPYYWCSKQIEIAASPPTLVMHRTPTTAARTAIGQFDWFLTAFDGTSDSLGLHRGVDSFGVMGQAVTAVLPFYFTRFGDWL